MKLFYAIFIPCGLVICAGVLTFAVVATSALSPSIGCNVYAEVENCG